MTRPATRVVRAGRPEPEQGAPFLPGPTFAGPFALAGDPASSPYVYGRYGNPTWTAYERALGELEGGEAVVFSSGMAAAAAVLGMLEDGAAVLLPADGYFNVRALAERERGLEVRLAPTEAGAIRAALPGARLAWVESPSNPGLDAVEIGPLAEAAHAAGAVLAVDNTLLTPLGLRPLEQGADLVVASATKALSGHSDLVLGYVATRDAERAEALRRRRILAGAAPGPFEVWLAHRSLATLDVRLDRACANALALAELLAARDDVAGVRYPGLPGDPAHEVAARTLDRHGTVLCFTLPDAAAAERFLATCELVTEATSFGGVHTTAERRARWGTDDVPEGFIRLSAGCEHPDDLRSAVSAALDAL